MFTEQQLRAAADARREALEGGARRSASGAPAALAIPGGAARSQAFPAQMRAESVTKDGKTFAQIAGCASAYERTYDMWDFWGPYKEKVGAAAGAKTLAASPDVVYLINHKGLTLARTVSGSLTLTEDDGGLNYLALCNPKRNDVADLLEAIRDGDVTENSFAFRITDGQWSPDYMEYTITEYDIDRGDVSAVNFGANPHTSIEARSADYLRALSELQGEALRAAHAMLGARLLGDVEASAPAPPAAVPAQRASVDYLRAALELRRV